ncbi:helix-turn-helix domain-containing protein [Paraburkholderia bannensis]|uniref:helix-turn-helix domain-containing protein n=1 Tax=Paraburkholderia bannensis TaxID=765414 RepID=UPI002ABE7A5A|nr:helix-turn-helix domain-containing protein [Paraburkholderia bannensis]
MVANTPSIDLLDLKSKEKQDPHRLDFLYPPRMEMKLWIRAARKKAGLTQEQLGEKLGVTKGNVSAWENGRHDPSYAQIQEMSALANMPLPDTEGIETPAAPTFGKPIRRRLEEMLQESGLDAQAFAARLKIPVERVEAWLQDGSASVEDAVSIQNEYGYSVAWILAGIGEKKVSPQQPEEQSATPESDAREIAPFSREYRPQPVGKWRRLAVLGMAQLGDNGYWADIEFAVGHGNGSVDWPTSDPDAYALKCEGESMLPRIRPGEYVIIEPNHPVQPGDEVVIKSLDGRVMIKELLFTGNGRYHLASVNASHGRISIPVNEVERMEYVGGIAKPSKWRPD